MEILFTKEFDRVFKKFLLQFSGTHPKWNIFQELLNMGGRHLRRGNGIHRLKPVFGRMHLLKPLENF